VVEKLGIEPGTRLDVEVAGDSLVLRPVRTGTTRVQDCVGILPNKTGPVPVDAFDRALGDAFRTAKL
jgi:antitoxin component of MazEF toxin-antitoxin module